MTQQENSWLNFSSYLKTNFVSNPLAQSVPETEKSYQKQYKAKHISLPKYLSELSSSEQLDIAFKIGAEVLAEKSIQSGATFECDAGTIQKILNSGNIRLIKLMLKNGLDVNKPVSTDFDQTISIFHMAAFETPELLPLLLSATDELTILPELHIAVLHNNIEKIAELSAKKVNIDRPDIAKCTALWWAILLNNYPVATLLIENGASLINFRKSSNVLQLLGHDVLEILIRKNQINCLELLLKNKLSVNTFACVKDVHIYKLLLVIAAEYGKADIICLLLKFNATVNPALSDNKLAELHDDLGYFCEWIELSAVAAAAKNNHVACLDILLNYDDINAELITLSHKDYKDHLIDRYTALMVAISGLSYESIEFLLLKGANPNQKGTWSAYRYNSPDDKIIDPLNILLKILPVKLKNELMQPNYDPINIIFKKSHRWFKILELLLNQGAHLNNTINDSFTISLVKNPIYIWQTKSDESSITHSSEKLNKANQQRFLLEALRILALHKTNFNQQDKKGKTILHYAAEYGYLEVVKYLIEKLKVDINIKDKQGESAIYSAAREVQEEVFNYLQKAGSDRTELNLQGETVGQLISTSLMKRFNL